MSLLDQFSSQPSSEKAEKETDQEKDEKDEENKKDSGSSSSLQGDMKKPLKDLATSRYLNYAMSVITSRALPDVRDGLKPVQRRILYAMHEDLRLTSNKKHRKSAAVVGKCLVAGTLISTPGGLIPIEEIKKGDTVCTSKGEGLVTKRFVKDPESLLKVTLAGGMHNTLTEDHPVRVLNKNWELEWKPSCELEKGDWVLLKSDNAFPLEYKSLPQFKGKEIDLTEDLAYLAGFYTADGYTSSTYGKNNRLRIGFVGGDHKIPVLERIQQILSDNFAYNPVLESREVPETGNETHNVRINYADLSDYLSKNLLGGFGSDPKHIHKNILRSPKKVALAFLSGFLDGDGHVRKASCHLNLSSISLKLLEQIQVLLLKMDVPSSLNVMREEGKSEILGRICPTQKCYAINVYGQHAQDLMKNLTLFREGHSELKKVYANNTTYKSMWNEIPYAGKIIFGEFSDKHLGSGWFKDKNGVKFRQGIAYPDGTKIRYSKELQEKRITRKDLDQLGILPKLEKVGSDLVPFLHTVLENGWRFQQVSDISEVTPEPTYDIRVESDHEFIANGWVVHNCLGSYHPHSDQALYQAMVRMAQDWNLRLPLVDGHGNFGSVDGDNAASMRYTEARLKPVISDLMGDIRKEAVTFRPNFDNTTTEPEVLPFSLPLLLINGATGIAVGMATNIPPHNIGNVCDASIDLLRNPQRRDSTLVRNHLIGPDFPTGGNIVESPEEIEEIYATGKGTVTIRSKWHTEKKGRKKYLVITEIPYAVAKQKLVEKIAQHIVDEQIPQVVDIRDESTSDIRVVLELKRGADIEAVMAYLLKYTPLQSSFHVNMTCLIPDPDNENRVIPKRLSLKEMLQEFLDFRIRVITKRLEYELRGLKERIHILEGFVTVLDDAQKAVDLVMASKSKEEARTAIMKHYSIDEDQANHVLDTKIYRLAAYEVKGVKEELKEKKERASEIEGLLADDEELKQILIDELKSLKKTYDDGRRTVIEEDLRSFEYDESLYIEDVDVHCVISRQGWVRRQKSYTDLSTLRCRDNDELGWVLSSSTRNVILFFTNKGKVYTERVDELPDTTGYGEPIQSLFSFENGEKVVAAFSPHDQSIDGTEEMVAITTDGSGVRFDLSKYMEPSTARGRSFMRVNSADDHFVVNVEPVTSNEGGSDDSDKDYVVIVTRDGRCLSFDPEEIRFVKGVGKGVSTITLSKDDSVLAFGMSSGTRGGSLSVETNRGATHDIRHTTHGVGARGQLGTVGIKRGSYTKWNRDVVEIK